MSRGKSLRVLSAAALIALLALWSPPSANAGRSVNVLYAGSLVRLNEGAIGPAFASRSGYAYSGKGAGSIAIANAVKSRLERPDVIELADPSVNKLLMGQANGSFVSWYFTFARTEMVIGYNSKSRFAGAFKAVSKHRLAWYKPLTKPGLLLGRTDPNLDPKGYRALFMAHLAERVYHLSGFARRVFGDASNPSQLFPEQVLATRLLAGQLDAGVFYLSEAKELKMPFIRLPARVNLGQPRYARLYATQHFRTAQGITVKGAPILYSVTIPRTVQDGDGAIAFVRFILGRHGRYLAQGHGLLPARLLLHGRAASVPPALLRLVRRK